MKNRRYQTALKILGAVTAVLVIRPSDCLQNKVRQFVLHGTEPAGEQPLVRADSMIRYRREVFQQ
jgi:hypothetical protein